MAGFIGEFPCTVDAKGRFLLPGALKKQIPAKEQKRFVVHRGIEKHLVIYTKKEWDLISEDVNRLNLYVRKNREFIRKFNRGATEMELDNTNRLLLPLAKKNCCRTKSNCRKRVRTTPKAIVRAAAPAASVVAATVVSVNVMPTAM